MSWWEGPEQPGLEAQWGRVYGCLKSRLWVSSPTKDILSAPAFPFRAEGLGRVSSGGSLIRTWPCSEVGGTWIRPEDAF